jgi:hypothetical protein
MSTSAFGVEHGGIAKAYLGGGKFKSVTKLKPHQRAMYKEDRIYTKQGKNSPYRESRGLAPEHVGFERAMHSMRAEDKAITSPGRFGRKTPPASGTMKVNGRQVNWGFNRAKGEYGATALHGGKSSGSAEVTLSSRHLKSAKQADSTFAHELAHAAPKRSSYRLHGQINASPKKSMREEARADMAGGTYYRNPPSKDDSGYVAAARAKPGWKADVKAEAVGGSRKGMKQYRKIQDKIAGSKRS